MSKNAATVGRLIKVVDNIETKLVFANTSSSLETFVNKYLVKMISLFSFDSVKLREKLNKIVNTFFVRIKSDEKISLPTSALSELMIKQKKNPFILNLSILFFDIAFEREKDQNSCLSSLFVGLSDLSEKLRKNLVNKVFVILNQINIPGNPTEKRKFYDVFAKNDADRKILLDYYQMLLFASGPKEWNEICGTKTENEAIVEKKYRMMKFLTNSEFSLEEIFPPMIIGCGINNRRISNLCEEFLKKQRGSLNLKDKKIVQLLFKFFFGKLPHQNRKPSEEEMRVIMRYLCKAEAATEVYVAVQVVLKGTIFNYGASHKLRILGCEFLNYCLRYGFRKASTTGKMEGSDTSEETEGEDEDTIIQSSFDRQDKFILSIFRNLYDLVHDLLSGTNNVMSRSLGYERLRFKETILQMYANFLKLFPEFIDKLHEFGFGQIELYFSEMKNESSQVKLILQTSLGILMEPYKFYIQHRNDKLRVSRLQKTFKKLMKEIIFEADDEIDNSRENMIYSALYCTNRLFPFSDTISRILNITQVSHPKLQIREEAKRGISVISFRSKYSSSPSRKLFKKNVGEKYPDFSEFVEDLLSFQKQSDHYFSDESMMHLCQFVEALFTDAISEKAKEKKDEDKQDKITIKKLLSTKKGYDFALDEFLEFLFTNLRKSGLVVSEISKFCLFMTQHSMNSLVMKLSRFLPQIEKVLFCGDGRSRKLVSKLFSFVAVNQCLVEEKMKEHLFKNILLKNFRAESTAHSLGNLQGAIYIVTYFTCFWYQKRGAIERDLRSMVDRIMVCLGHPKEMISVTACEAIGYLGMNNIFPALYGPFPKNPWTKKPEKNLESKEKKNQESYLDILESSLKMLDEQPFQTDGNTEEVEERRNDGTRTGKYREESKKKRRRRNDMIGLLDLLLSLLRMSRERSIERVSGNATRSIPKLEEEVLRTFGKICHPKIQSIGGGKSVAEFILPELMKYRYSKNTEIQFTIGEALSLICGNSTLHEQDKFIFHYDETEDEVTERKKVLKKVLQNVISEGTLSPQSIVRQNTSIWLVSIVKHCQNSEILRPYVYDLQESFSRLITDHTNRVTASAASRGLAYTYQIGKGDKKLQSDLVQSLMDAFSGKTYYRGDLLIIKDMDYTKKPKKQQENKNSNGMKDESLTDARDEAEVNKKETGERKDVPSSYKELVRIANEIGDPTLVYKFLNISNQNQIWNSKRAAAFSTLTIMQNSKNAEEMKIIFPKIFPKLFVYQYDPNADVADCMNDMIVQYSNLENVSVQDLAKRFCKKILDEIHSTLHAKQWRTRQSAVKALGVFLGYPGRTFDELESIFISLLKKVLIMIDDTKESVGKIAVKVIFGELRKFLLKCFDFKHVASKSSPSSLARCVDLLFPYLLEHGIGGPLELIRIYSIVTVMKIMEIYKDQDFDEKKKNYKLLFAKYIPKLVETMLTLMSQGAESSKVQMLGSHLGEIGISTEQFNEMRIKASSSINSPVHETLNICTRFICKQNLEETIQRLIAMIKNSTGVLTRVHTMRVVSSLAKSNRSDISYKQTTRLLNCIFGFIDAEVTINEKKEMAICISLLLNCASNMRKKDIILDRIPDIYFMSENRARRMTGSEADAEERDSKIVATLLNSIQARAPKVFEDPQFYPLFVQIMFFGCLTNKMICQHEVKNSVSSIYRNLSTLFNKSDEDDGMMMMMNTLEHSLIDQFWLSPTLESKKGGASKDTTFAMIDEEDDPDEIRDDVKIFRKLWREMLMDSESRTVEEFCEKIVARCYTFWDHRTFVYRNKGSLGMCYLADVISNKLQFMDTKQRSNHVMNSQMQQTMIRKILQSLKKTKMIYKGKEYLMKALGIVCNRNVSSGEDSMSMSSVVAEIMKLLCGELKRRKKKVYLIETLQTLQLILLNKAFRKHYFSEDADASDLRLSVTESLDAIVSDISKKEEEADEERLKLGKKKKKKTAYGANFGFVDSSAAPKKVLLSKIDDRLKVKVFECLALAMVGEEKMDSKAVEKMLEKLEILKTQKLTNAERFGLFFSFLVTTERIARFYEKQEDKEYCVHVLCEMKKILLFNMDPQNVSYIVRKALGSVLMDLFVPTLRRLGLFSSSKFKKEVKSKDTVMYIQELKDLMMAENNHQLKDALERLKNKILMEV